MYSLCSTRNGVVTANEWCQLGRNLKRRIQHRKSLQYTVPITTISARNSEWTAILPSFSSANKNISTVNSKIVEQFRNLKNSGIKNAMAKPWMKSHTNSTLITLSKKKTEKTKIQKTKIPMNLTHHSMEVKEPLRRNQLILMENPFSRDSESNRIKSKVLKSSNSKITWRN